MMRLAPMLLMAALAFAENKPLPNQAGNDDVDLAGTVVIERPQIQQELGMDMGAGYMLVQIKVTPKGDAALRVGPDDFTLLSRKNGDRSPALDPQQIAGTGGALIVKPAAQQPGGDGTRTNGPIWGGVTPKAGGAKDGDSRLLGVLKEKALQDQETKKPVEGLLYFALDGKLKPKDVSLIYKGPAGKLVIDFK
ncbi:MAG TPA: hypothetical protein VEV85_25015 [Bryobacteraceae bacterium]|jgi:hypothetical protein|nr:hypothetical protein [Bryobacteraceae bacterium]